MDGKDDRTLCTAETEVWSRTVGFYRPVREFNKGLKEQYSKRKMYDVDKSMNNEIHNLPSEPKENDNE